MKKKLSAILAAISLALPLALPFSANAAFSDVPDTNKYKEAITTLSILPVQNAPLDANGKETTSYVLGGYDDGTFAPDKDITRAEFTKILIYMLGYAKLSNKITSFEDLAADHWANCFIKTAFDLGIINGFSDTEFAPDSPVTYEQALKMVVCVLGYQTDADANGGYPDGYRAEGTSLKLTDGISGVEYTANASRGVVAQIMYNALEVKLREKENTKWENTNKTLLNDYLNVYKLKGTVVGVEESTTAACDNALSPGQFAIDDDKTGTEYVIDYTESGKTLSDMTSYLGKTIQIFYRQDTNSEDRWLVQIDNETYTNKEITINSKDLSEFDNYTLKYYPNNAAKTTSLKLDKTDLTIRYNGRVVNSDVTIGNSTYSPIDALTQWLDDDSDAEIYGTVRLIDSGSTGNYNVVDIYDYDTIVVYATPVSPDYRISDKTLTGNSITLNADSADYKMVLTKDNQEISASSLKANDVVNYATSLDGTYITAYATSQSVTGTITAINLSDTNKTISIDNTEYNVSDRFLTYIEKKDQKTLETGVKITAYKDYLGTLEWGTITKTTTYYPYAYVVDAVSDADDYFLKLYAPTSATITSLTSSTSYKVKSYKIQSENPKLNGKKSSPEAITAALEAHATLPDSDISGINVKGTKYNQLIKVLFSSAGEVEDVITLSDTEGTTNEDGNSLVKYKGMDASKKYYATYSAVKESSSGSTFYTVRSSTPIFVIPVDRTNSDAYALKAVSSLSDGGSYYLDAYDLSTTKYPTALCIYNTNLKSGTAITTTTAYRLLSKNVEQVYDQTEDEIFDTIYAYAQATTVSTAKIAPGSQSVFADAVKGDVIMLGTDSDKHADTVIKAIDFDDVQSVLSGEIVNDQTYNWLGENEEQTEANHYQKYKLDFRYPKATVSDPDNYWLTGSNATNIRSRAFMCNVLQVLTEDKQLYVSQMGFDADGNINQDDYTAIKYTDSTKIVRYDADSKEFTPYVQGTESTALTALDFKAAEDLGKECSKILVVYSSTSSTTSTSAPTAKFIVIYG